MDYRFIAKIKRTIRKLTWQWEPYVKVKEAAKVDLATFECKTCGKYCYTGKSKNNLTKLKEKYKMKVVEQEKIYIDHIEPVENPLTDWEGWDIYMERLFCSEENLQPLCFVCHNKKTNEEKDLRKKVKKTKKKKAKVAKIKEKR